MIKEELHEKIVERQKPLLDWFLKHREGLDLPIYTSYDIRDSGLKIAVIDANIYPAGFNNICQTDREHAPALVQKYLGRHYPGITSANGKILILTEEHTNNPYYWDNVIALNDMFAAVVRDVRVAIPRARTEVFEMVGASGRKISVSGAVVENGKIRVDGFSPDLIISNNDFSDYYAEWGDSLSEPMNPPRELGWFQRKKSRYFKHYNQLVGEFAEVLGVDPWTFTVETKLVENFDLANEDSKKQLLDSVAGLFQSIEKKNRDRGIADAPVAFIKNNAGTYGLAVMRVSSLEEVQALNYKTRKKMKAAKGGRDVEEVIVQEGIASIVQSEGSTAEPTIYLMGCQLLGGFLRAHAEKGPTDSLNTPGAIYRRLCVSDLKTSVSGHPLENVYGWIARIGLLAVGKETQEMGVKYIGYQQPACE